LPKTPEVTVQLLGMDQVLPFLLLFSIATHTAVVRACCRTVAPCSCNTASSTDHGHGAVYSQLWIYIKLTTETSESAGHNMCPCTHLHP
jgi:hypothetical protein